MTTAAKTNENMPLPYQVEYIQGNLPDVNYGLKGVEHTYITLDFHGLITDEAVAVLLKERENFTEKFPQYADTLLLAFDVEGWDDSPSLRYVYQMPETQYQWAQRVKCEEYHAIERQKYERKEFERLKAQFEGTSSAGGK